MGEKNSLAIENARLKAKIEELERENSRKEKTLQLYRKILYSQGRMLSEKDLLIQNHEFERMKSYLELFESTDPYTAGHSLTVTKYAVIIAKAMGLPFTMIDLLHRGGHMHDIGKLRWNEDDFKKKTLTEEDRKRFRDHPIIGARYLEDLAKKHKEYEGLAPIARYHHERYDGISIKTNPNFKYAGYPGELCGEAIPLPARIVACADSFDAMTADRAYKEKMPILTALEEMKRCSGMKYDEEIIPDKDPELQFDPNIVEAFLSIKIVGSSKTKIAHVIGCQDFFEINSLDMVVNPENFIPCKCIKDPPRFIMYKHVG